MLTERNLVRSSSDEEPSRTTTREGQLIPPTNETMQCPSSNLMPSNSSVFLPPLFCCMLLLKAVYDEFEDEVKEAGSE
jgi:hypothetical protein